ncbi:hypothetical protein EVAR_39168_1 [Eumeta japonica]|uniref:Uncharacterized protein n=1 Tax=Eumeta variegata TaxID=151549 RepID=A0A4C1S9N9_EUMVA|nr:hypothetical protein EVAR_39168_1 [Eumeta japonica]
MVRMERLGSLFTIMWRRPTSTDSFLHSSRAGGWWCTCPGPHTESGACHLAPCEAHTHLVAVFNGEGSLVFNFDNKRSALFHAYIRFMPLSAHGVLIRRGSVNDQNGLFVQLSLHRWRLCAEANGPAKNCGITRICSTRLFDPTTWHSAVFAVTGDGILVRIDDFAYIRGSFSCDPELYDEPFVIHVGEKFHGELQEIIINFIPLNFKIEKKFNEFGYTFFPNAATNIAYEKGSIAEGFLLLQDDQYLRLPCFYGQHEWFLKLTVKPQWHSGGTPETLKWKLSDDVGSFTGLIASLRINGILQDLLEFSVERHRNDIIQVSSRTASISGSYRETAWGKSGRLNLTCLHARSIRSPQSAYWLYLDTGIESAFKDKVRSIEDGRVLRLVATADNNLRGFYTCRARVGRHVRNVATYGVIGQALKYTHSLDSTTFFAICTSGILVVVTLGWLIFEAFYDLRHGYGFFRDLHISPEEEAEAICKFIDLNSKEIGSKSAIRLAKTRARSLALTRRVASEQSSTTHFELKNMPSHNFVEDLSADSGSYEQSHLPNIKKVIDNDVMVYRCEPSYISSPRHGSCISSKRKFNSVSSGALSIPCDEKTSTTSQVATVKSKSFTMSPGQKIIEKFRQLYNED